MRAGVVAPIKQVVEGRLASTAAELKAYGGLFARERRRHMSMLTVQGAFYFFLIFFVHVTAVNKVLDHFVYDLLECLVCRVNKHGAFGLPQKYLLQILQTKAAVWLKYLPYCRPVFKYKRLW